jgi:phage terminase large subunit-like protein
MISAHPWLAARTKTQHFHKMIFDLETGSQYAALSREANTKMGLNPSFVCYDEYGLAPDDEPMDSAMGAREDPLLMVISTQAADDAAPLSRLIDYGLKVKARQMRDPSFHLSLYCAALDDDPWDPKTWKKANPALGAGGFRSLEDVKRLEAQAQRMPGQQNSFKNLEGLRRAGRHFAWLAHLCRPRSRFHPRHERLGVDRGEPGGCVPR